MIVQTSEVAYIERFGQFSRLAQPGFNLYCAPFERKLPCQKKKNVPDKLISLRISPAFALNSFCNNKQQQ
jgi:regulator of protease activity HflC (stomatin/prohibitin superfamily)